MNQLQLRQLQSVDWDFPERVPGTTVNHHWYPGTFPSQIPSTLVQSLSSVDDLVFDPYGGIGTTSTESLRLGRKSWYVEHNPVAAIAAYTKAALIILEASDRGSGQRLLGIMESIVESKNLESTEELGLEVISHDFLKADEVLARLIRPIPSEFISIVVKDLPQWSMISKWYHPLTLEKIKSIFSALHSMRSGDLAALVLLTMLSACMKPGSSQTKSWGHIADNVLPKKDEFMDKDVFVQATRWLRKLKKSLLNSEITRLEDRKSVRAWVSVHNWNTENKPKHSPRIKPDLLVTSPPYGGAIDYILGQRLSLYLLGYSDCDIALLCNQEIGARRKRFKPESKHIWAEELICALRKQVTYVTVSGRLAFVLPHKEAGRKNGSDALEECLSEYDWHKVFSVDRSIRQLRTRQRWTSIKRETIQIYENS